ncbi:hypothetical protein BESB_001170 [Besnoitia besnoiti]|uniref:C3HC-type domain-containing protein n=1 Tax=Besnoitia besnoiti TaxID=94643 RepID=A0A2A9MIG4_BESBE|nr:hypothetical protein BESB_001170 [Besnoitia besnoiti]PFH37775.1 hypothetical protein BESB_001170 [Besnoitia besnoiti]
MTGATPPASADRDVSRHAGEPALEKLSSKSPAVEYRDLLRSYFSDSQRWLAPPPSLSPFLLARAGFQCADTRVIRCPLCGAQWTWRKRKARAVPPASRLQGEHLQQRGHALSSENGEQGDSSDGTKKLRRNDRSSAAYDSDLPRAASAARSSKNATRGAPPPPCAPFEEGEEVDEEEDENDVLDAVALSFLHSECCPRRASFISLFDVDLAGPWVLPLALVNKWKERTDALQDCLVSGKHEVSLPLVSLRSAIGYLSSLLLTKSQCLAVLTEGRGILDPVEIDGVSSLTSDSTAAASTSERQKETASSSSTVSPNKGGEASSLSLLLQLIVLLFHPCFSSVVSSSAPVGGQAMQVADLTGVLASRQPVEKPAHPGLEEPDLLKSGARGMAASAPAHFSLESCRGQLKSFLQRLSVHGSTPSDGKLSLEDILRCVMVDPFEVLALFGWSPEREASAPRPTAQTVQPRSSARVRVEAQASGSAEDASGPRACQNEEGVSREAQGLDEGAAKKQHSQSVSGERRMDCEVECTYCLRKVQLRMFRQCVVTAGSQPPSAADGEAEEKAHRGSESSAPLWKDACSTYTQAYCETVLRSQTRPAPASAGVSAAIITCDGESDFVLGVYLPSPRVAGREPGVFDPVRAHRLHCPYISSAVYGGPAVVEKVISALLPLRIRGFEQASAREELRKEAMRAWRWRNKLEAKGRVPRVTCVDTRCESS